MSISVECPSCGVPVKMNANAKLGQTVTCNACQAKLEVIWLDPIELDILLDDDEQDFDDSFYDDLPDDPYEDYEFSEQDYDDQ
ncbi:MAG: hypothetical protein FJ010_12225 [Chloroflexi bacterium]|nr:hypothetical protein [Chloroflexota bacterium]